MGCCALLRLLSVWVCFDLVDFSGFCLLWWWCIYGGLHTGVGSLDCFEFRLFAFVMCLVWCSWLGCWFGCFVGFGDLWLVLRFMVLLLVRWMCVVLQLLWFRWLLSGVFVCLLSWSRLLLAWVTWVGGCVCCLVLLIVLVFRIWFGCLGGWVEWCVVLVNCCSIAWYADYCAVCLLCRWLLGDLF